MTETIQVRDRATLFSLVIGLNGFTVSYGHYRPQAEQSEHYRAAARDGRQHAYRSHPQEKRGIQPLCELLCEGTEKASVDRLRQHRDSGVSVEHRNDSWSFDIEKAAKRHTFSGSFFIGFFSTFPAQTAEAWGTAPDDRRAYRKSARFYSAGAVHRSWLQDRPD